MENKNVIKSYKVSKSRLMQLINPHLQNFHSFDKDDYDICIYNSSELFFNTDRFDLIAKYIYIEYTEKQLETDWHKDVYKEHIRIFSDNTFKEGDGRKSSLEDYYIEFNHLIQDIKEHGFDDEKSILPIDKNMMVVDGAHRITASFFFNSKVSTIKLKRTYFCDYNFFISKGISIDVADFMAFKYCKLNVNSKIANLFPISKVDDNIIEAILKKHGNIYYKKKIFLTKKAQHYVVKEMYLTEHWIGDKSDNFSGAVERANISFDNKNTLTVYVYIPFSEKSAIESKAEIRNLINKGNYPIHINDTHKETIRLAQTYFNENSIHFINQKQGKEFSKFNTLFDKYKNWINNSQYDIDDFCIDASSVLSLYGLREGADLDFLYSKKEEVITNIDLLDCHNIHSHYYKTPIDNIIYNPENHFYYNDCKVISIQLLRSMKEYRNEEKDKTDVLLIDSIKTSKFNYLIKNKLHLFKRNIRKLRPSKIYKNARVNAHKIIPKDSFLWNITKKTFCFFKKIKNKKKHEIL